MTHINQRIVAWARSKGLVDAKHVSSELVELSRSFSYLTRGIFDKDDLFTERHLGEFQVHTLILAESLQLVYWEDPEGIVLESCEPREVLLDIVIAMKLLSDSVLENCIEDQETALWRILSLLRVLSEVTGIGLMSSKHVAYTGMSTYP